MTTPDKDWFFFKDFFEGDPSRFWKIIIEASVQPRCDADRRKILASHLLEVGGGDFFLGHVRVHANVMDTPQVFHLETLANTRKTHGWLLSHGFVVDKSETSVRYNMQTHEVTLRIFIVYVRKQWSGSPFDLLPEPTEEQLVILREKNVCIN